MWLIDQLYIEPGLYAIHIKRNQNNLNNIPWVSAGPLLYRRQSWLSTIEIKMPFFLHFRFPWLRLLKLRKCAFWNSMLCPELMLFHTWLKGLCTLNNWWLKSPCKCLKPWTMYVFITCFHESWISICNCFFEKKVSFR